MQTRCFIRFIILPVVFAALFVFAKKAPVAEDDRFISYTVDPLKQELKFYWKDGQYQIFRSIQNLKDWLNHQNKTLLFAMNGGMYKADNTPLGLFVENQTTVSPLNKSNGTGNFYLKPNGVFYITRDNLPFICNSTQFQNNGTIKYATQSGPMLVIDGQIHPAFKQGSANLNIRNGVGILPGNKVVFAISKTEVSLYDFAAYFKKLGCKNALYLDGFVSRMYLPEKQWLQLDGNFGVIIAITAEKK